LVGLHRTNARVAPSIQIDLTHRENVLIEALDELLDRLLDLPFDPRVRKHGIGVVASRHPHRPAFVVDAGHVAVLVKRDLQPADVAVLPRRRYYWDLSPVDVDGDQGVAAEDVSLVAGNQHVIGIREQLIAPTGDRDIDAIEVFDQCEIAFDVLKVTDENDLIDAVGF
jgi:hypothetical protein